MYNERMFAVYEAINPAFAARLNATDPLIAA
jgi:hypothetical protein